MWVVLYGLMIEEAHPEYDNCEMLFVYHLDSQIYPQVSLWGC